MATLSSYSCLENIMDRGTWWATVHGVTKSQAQLKQHSSSKVIFTGLGYCNMDIFWTDYSAYHVTFGLFIYFTLFWAHVLIYQCDLREVSVSERHI